MLRAFDLHILLKPSRDYFRCAILLHLFAMYACYQAGLPDWFIYGALAYLVCSLGHLGFNRIQAIPYTQLSYQQGCWTLFSKQGNTCDYTQAELKFDGGFFFYVRFMSDYHRKTLVIFNDQLSPKDRHSMKMLCRLK